MASSDNNPIGWCDVTWNPVRGCSRVSPGCDNCYAMGQAHRFSGTVNGKPGPFRGLTTKRKGKVDWSGRVRFIPEALTIPQSWREPKWIFVNSMSDLFHESLTNEEIAAVFGAMACCSKHTFQILTKRAKRMREWFQWIEDNGTEVCQREFYCHTSRVGPVPWEWPMKNVWLGVSAEDQKRADERVPFLLRTPAAVRFVSAEPLLGPIDFGFGGMSLPDYAPARPLPQLDWVIVGGEAGPRAREFREEWAWSILMQCQNARVPVYFKQYGSASTYSGMGDDDRIPHGWKDRSGKDETEWFERFRIREFPEARP